MSRTAGISGPGASRHGRIVNVSGRRPTDVGIENFAGLLKRDVSEADTVSHRFLDKRGCYYILWTQSGRSRERSTGMTDREQAEQALAEFIHARQRHSGPRDPSQILITDFLAN